MGGKQYSDGQRIQVSALSKTTAKPNTHVTRTACPHQNIATPSREHCIEDYVKNAATVHPRGQGASTTIHMPPMFTNFIHII